VRDGWARRRDQRQPPFPALQDAIDEVFESRIGDVSGRGKLAGDMREIWMMQPRFEKRVGSTPFSLVDQPRFRAGFDFMRLRADAGEIDVVLADWWQEFSMADDGARQSLIDQARDEQQGQARQPRVHTVRSTAAAAPVAPAPDGEEPQHGDAPRKRRRRRRSNAGQGPGTPSQDAGN
jgi:poly(A) polymerase